MINTADIATDTHTVNEIVEAYMRLESLCAMSRDAEATWHAACLESLDRESTTIAEDAVILAPLRAAAYQIRGWIKSAIAAFEASGWTVRGYELACGLPVVSYPYLGDLDSGPVSYL